MVSKNAEFHADFKSVKKELINALKKSYKQTSLRNMSKSEKVHISVSFLVITLL